MKRILFVCHGNICRSPMAEIVFWDMLRREGLEGAFEVASAATSTEEIWNGVGNPVYPPARAELLRHGLSCEGKRAVQLQKSDYEKYDLLIAMDERNVRNMLRMLGGDPAEKICKLLAFTGSDADVADPWYTGDFERTYRDICKGCTALLEKIKNKNI